MSARDFQKSFFCAVVDKATAAAEVLRCQGVLDATDTMRTFREHAGVDRPSGKALRDWLRENNRLWVLVKASSEYAALLDARECFDESDLAFAELDGVVRWHGMQGSIFMDKEGESGD